MKYLNKIASTLFAASLGILTMTSCEGGDLYKVDAPEWLSEMGGGEEETTIVEITPNPSKLGSPDNTTGWWTEFTDDIKAEPGMTYQVKFTNYGGGSNWNNFVLILRNEAKDYEYGVFRSDNWCWNTKFSDGGDSDQWCSKKMENSDRDWAAWLKAMDRSKCTATIINYGDGTAYIKVVMAGSDGNTYTQEYSGFDVDKDNLYFSFTVDNSHIEFGDIDVSDSEPASMEVTGVPGEVLYGTTFEEAMANVSAIVTYESGLKKTVPAGELLFEAIPDFETLGQKTLVVVYNKTYLGANCTTPLVAVKTFKVVNELSAFTQTVVVPSPLVLGAEDNSSAWWSVHTDNIKVAPKETKVVNFTNYTSGGSNWNNFVIVLNKANLGEYAVVRADNYGWGDGYAACKSVGGFSSDEEWAAWLTAMNGAKVTAYITNNGDGTANIKAVMYGTDGNTYVQEYNGINTINPDDLYFRFTIDGCHLVFDNTLGTPDCTTAWWSTHSPLVQVKPHQVCTVNFTNYTSGASNWNNYVVVLNRADLSEYAVVRADNYGWGDGYAACKTVGGFSSDAEWAAWLAAMNGAKVKMKIINNGDGTADIKAEIRGNDGKDYIQEYNGINTIDPDNFYFRFTVDGSYLVFE